MSCAVTFGAETQGFFFISTVTSDIAPSSNLSRPTYEPLVVLGIAEPNGIRGVHTQSLI